MNYLSRTLGYLKPHWKLAGFSVALMILGGLASLLLPWPLKFLVDNVLQGEPLPPALAWLLGPVAANRSLLLVLSVAAGLLFTLLCQGLSVLDNYVNTKIDQNMVLDFRSDLFQHAQRLSMTFHDQRRSGQLIYAINFQADAAARLVMTIPPLVQSLLTLLGMFWISFLIDAKLALLSLTVVPFLYCSIRYYLRNIEQRLVAVKGMEGESLSIIHEAVSMLRVIVAFGREDHEYRRFRDQGERTINARIKLTVQQTLFSLAVNMITATGTALVLGYGAWHALQGRLTVGQLLVVMAYIAAIYKPLETISTTIGSLQEVFVALRVAFKLLETEPEIKDVPGAVAVKRARGRVAFEGVYFNYDRRVDTLQNICFEARAGQVVGVVGPTGAGKTTLLSLLPRFYEVKKGRILLDGTDVRQLTLRSLREQISIVLQEPMLFSGSIADNIRYGRLDASGDEIRAAARAANAHDFIMALPRQYETEVGERGVKISAGERQRICVARAFLKDAPILILDEPTSSIDSKTEAIILEALDRLMVGRTTFMIAHRLSTIHKADLMLVVDHGRLVEQGTHDELLRQRGLYKQLYDIQTRHPGRDARADLHALPTAALGGQA
ncbi:MAG TPA: ABC transporter ATP-binding protein [Gemmataceae bacterium]|nr:ABC transporter ATP-binding protein [Gemmataceae bacterium]